MTTLVVRPNAPKPSELLADGLKLLRGGRNWIKLSMKVPKVKWMPFLGYNFCSVGAMMEVNTPNELAARAYLNQAAGTIAGMGSMALNDLDETTFADIERMFNLARELAIADGN